METVRADATSDIKEKTSGTPASAKMGINLLAPVVVQASERLCGRGKMGLNLLGAVFVPVSVRLCSHDFVLWVWAG